MPTVSETERNCPECGTPIRATATQCGCGWKAMKLVGAGPDYNRMAADRAKTMASAFKKYEGPRACQERTCRIGTRAMPGKDFCETHQAQFEREPDSVRRHAMPGNVRRMLQHLET